MILPRSALLLVLLAINLGAADVPRTGAYTTTFRERGVMSSWAMFVERMGATYHLPKDQAEPREAAYDLTQEPYDVYVPGSYDDSVPYGLIAYVNSGNGGGPPGRYAEICDRHKLIWIGGTRIGNERPTWTRMRLTIDGVANLRTRYRIDAERIYVMGQSGGGRVSSLMAVPFADVFSGGIYLIGCNPFQLPSDKTVAARLDALARTRRFAFITGPDDYNKPGTVEAHATYQGLAFPHLIYLEQPGLGHSTPAAEWFERAVVFNDAPAIAAATTNLADGKELEASKQYREAYAAYQAAAQCGVAENVTAEARPAVTRLALVLDGEAANDLSALGEKPSGGALRAFGQKWPPELPTTVKARTIAERVAQKEFDQLAANRPAVGVLRGFLKAWDGYAVCARAITALDLYAKEAWPKTQAIKTGVARWKALAKFSDDWTPTPSAALAAETSAKEIAARVAEAEALPTEGAKTQRLKLLYLETKGTPANAAVQTALIEVALQMQGGDTKP